MITYITDVREGESDFLPNICHLELIVKSLDGVLLMSQVAPESGWTYCELAAIQQESFDEGADAYLGDHWIGSTEV
ncbi:hypothetical protein [Yersinia pekkanenii]|uniref:Uncharacterized protein n=1 Tax=Yersinia pekkanenii TaxID=1288385 RepID=A0A0T9RKG9_9GAMM|nr:hypothetical protein [Yersinia pekkanenii]CNI67844.1 Uncharacterised protein [Yersinia pekkanenii]CRY69679.1 Uncharacterised protein [Yersinia pekkanenii]